MEQLPSPLSESEMREKFEKILPRALPYEVAMDLEAQQEEAYKKATMPEASESDIAELEAIRSKLLDSSIMVHSLADLRTLLNIALNEDQNLVQDAMEHENAHANVVEREGAIFNGYCLRIMKMQQEGSYGYRPSVDFDTPLSWPAEKRIEVYKRILEAPEEYGNAMSKSDKQRLSEVE